MSGVPGKRAQVTRGIAVATGLVAAVCGLLGLLYNGAMLATSLAGGFDEMLADDDLPYFYPALYLMSAACILCYLTLLVGGVQLCRARLSLAPVLVVVWVFEVVYFFAVARAWLSPSLGMSIAAATGVANGGLMFQFVIGLPLWGPACLLWVWRSERSAADERVRTSSTWSS